MSHLSLRPQGQNGPFYNPSELASNLQHLQHLHSVQQQIAAAAGASGYWSSSSLNNGTSHHSKGRDHHSSSNTEDILQQHPTGWRYNESGTLSIKPFASSTEITPPMSSSKRKRTESETEDAERRSSPVSFNHDGKSLIQIGLYIALSLECVLKGSA